MKPAIGISEKHLTEVIGLLSPILSDEVALYTKTRKFHWNVSGESFMELHQLFEGQYKELEMTIDAVAERINQLGGRTIGTMQEFLQHTRITEVPSAYPAQQEMIRLLLSDHELVIRELRKDIETCADTCKDAGTADFLTGIMEQHEIIAWKLRRYLN